MDEQKIKLKQIVYIKEQQGIRILADQYLDIARSLIAVIGADGRVELVNKKGLESLGYKKPEEVIGRSFIDFLSEQEKPHLVNIFNQILTTKTQPSKHQEATIISKDGERKNFSFDYTLLKDEQKNIAAILVSGEDITKRKQDEDELKRKSAEVSFANKILKVFAEETGSDMFFDALNVVLEQMQSRHGVFGYIDSQGHLICESMTRMLAECEVEDKCIHYPPEKWKGLWARALKEKQVLYTNKEQKVPPRHPLIHNNLAAPIVFQDRVIGLLNIANKKNGYLEDDKELLQKVADRIAPVLYAWIQKETQEIERKRAENVLRKRKDELEALFQSARAVLQYKDFEKIARAIFDSAKELTGATAGYVALLNEETNENEILFLDAGGMPCTVDPNLPMPVRGLREVAYRKAKTVFENDFAKSQWQKLMPKGHAKLYNVMFAPLLVQGKAVGIMGLANKEGGFNDNDARIATAFTDLAAISLTSSRLQERLTHLASFPQLNPNPIFEVDYSGNITYANPITKILFADLKKKQTTHPFLSDFSNIVSILTRKNKDILVRDINVGDKIFQQTVSRVPKEKTIRFYNADITERTKATKKLKAERKILETTMENTNAHLAYLDNDMRFVTVNSTYALGSGHTKKELIGKNHFDIFPNEENERIFKKVRDSGKEVEYKAKPFEFTDQPWRETTYWDWTLAPVKDDQGKVDGLILSLVDVTEAVRSKQYSDALNKINEILHSTLNFEQIADRVTKEAAEAIRCEAAGINLRKEGYWVRTTLFGIDKRFLGEKLTNEQNRVAALIANAKKPVIINDVSKDTRINQSFVKRYGVKSTMVFPLISRDKVLGVIFFNYRSAAVTFNKQQIDFANRLSASLSLALENARLYEGEHRIAETLQKSLLPAKYPKIEGLEFEYYYQSASAGAEVGGDFYDVFEITPGYTGIVMGDVAGKGIDAAAETAKVKYLLRDKASLMHNPEQVIADVNNSLFIQKTDVFTALTYAIYDTNKSIIKITNSGNPYPYLVNHNRFVQVTGVPVSISKDQQYETKEIPLNRGDAIIMYTDGLIEARCKGKLFSEEGVRAFVRANKDQSLKYLIKGLVEEARQFSCNNLTDDILVIGIRKK